MGNRCVCADDIQKVGTGMENHKKMFEALKSWVGVVKYRDFEIHALKKRRFIVQPCFWREIALKASLKIATKRERRKIRRQLRKIYKKRIETIVKGLNHGKNIIYRKRRAKQAIFKRISRTYQNGNV